MLVRSSRYYAEMVARERAEMAREQAIKDLKVARAQAELAQAGARAEAARIRAEAALEVARVMALLAEREHDYIDQLVHKEVFVHLRTNHSMEGILIGAYQDSIVVRHAKVPDPESGTIINLEGDQVVPRDNVNWVQELTASP